MASVKMPYLLLRTDHEARCTYISPMMKTIVGRDPSEFLGEPLADVPLPNDATQRLVDAFHAVLEGRAPVVMPCTVPTPEGDQRWECALCPEFDGDGAVCAVSAVVQEMRAAGTSALAAETQLHDILEHSRDLIYRLNLRTGAFDCLSRSAQAITGLDVAEMHDLGIEGFWARIHPDDSGRFLENTEALLAGRNEREDDVLEFRFRHASGEYRWLSDSRAVVRDARGAAVALAGALRDVTQQKRVQSKQINLLEELAASRDRLEQVVRQMPIGVTIADAATGNLVMANEEALRVLGRSLGDTLGRGGAIPGAIHPDGRPYRADEYPQARSLGRGEVIVGEEILCRRGDGAETVLSVTCAPIYDQERRIIAAVSTLTDISERKRAEEALRDSERRFRAAIDHFPGMLAIYDSDRRIQFINSTGLRLCGRPEVEVLGR